MNITRRTARTKQLKLEGLLPDPVEERAAAVSRAKSICAFTTKGSKMRRELSKIHYGMRQKACENRKGKIWICGYTTKKDKVVKPYCRRFPKKKKKT